MKHKFFSLLLAGAALSVTAPVFSHSHHDTVVVVEQPAVVVAPPAPVVIDEPGPSVMLVQEAPPVERVEVIPAAPNPQAYWVKGCWKWNNGWAWSPGYYVQRPSVTAVWVPGVWVKHHHRHGWYYTEGHWQ